MGSKWSRLSTLQRLAAACLLPLAAALAALVLPVSPAQALSLVVIVNRDDDASGLACSGGVNDCSLRSAVEKANTDSVTTTILFASTRHTITLGASLSLSASSTIVSATPAQTVKINANGNGQVFQISASDIRLSGLRIYGSGAGASNIYLFGSAKRVAIDHNTIGASDPVAPCGVGANSSYGGIYVASTGVLGAGEARAWIYGNTINCHQGTPGDGIDVVGTDGVVIGADESGSAANDRQNIIFGNDGHGVMFNSGASNNVLRNSAMGFNGQGGVALDNAGANKLFGSTVFFNNAHGVELRNGSAHNQIGCPAGGPNDATTRNYVFGNQQAGIYLAGVNTHANDVFCNWVGVRDSYNVEANLADGVVLDDYAYQNRIGDTAAERNLISGNAGAGVRIYYGAHDNTVAGNYIGTDITGTAAVSNSVMGIVLQYGAVRNVIGGPSGPNLNLIAGNGHGGVYIANSDTASNTLQYNDIGYNSGKSLPLPNGGHGVSIFFGAHDNVLTGTSSASGNYIGYNVGSGVHLISATKNIIGPGRIFSNSWHGVALEYPDTIFNRIDRAEIYNNTWDGIGEQRGAAANVWTRVSIYGNGGLGVDKNSSSSTANIVDTPYPTITSVNPATRVISGKALATVALISAGIVELYRVAPDPSGFGEGKTFVGTTTTDSSGNWSIVDPNPVGCYTAFETDIIVLAGIAASSEFGPNSCRDFLPLILR